MKVSVIVPVYNVEQYLEKCLLSLVNQSLKDMEIIIVNDGSKDRSQEIIDRYVERYNNIVSLEKENGGLSDARNYGVQYAKGEYVAFVDSDDYVDYTMFEKMYHRAVEGNLDVVVCDTVIQFSTYSYILKSNMRFSEENVRNYIFAPPMACTRIVKREIMQCFPFQKGIYYEDLNTTPTYVVKTKKIGFLEEALYFYVQRADSIMNQMDFHEKLLDIFKVLDNVRKVYLENFVFEKFHDEIEYLYLIHLLRSASLRFLQYKNTEIYLKKINQTIRAKFPNWKMNPYFKQSNIKFKIVCYLAYEEKYSLLKFLSRIKK